jgi:uncharacterized repeat protein (TIGR01451 family)
LSCAVLPALTAGAQTVQTHVNRFTNSASVAVPTTGAATPYPLTIELSGVPGRLNGVEVGLRGLRHNVPDDLDALLVAPGGQAVLLMSDAGGFQPINNVNLVFSNAAAAFLPDSGQIVSGSFKPTDFEPGDLLPFPAPFGPYTNSLTDLLGTDPNGTWSLYMADDTPGDDGTLTGGWHLTLVTTNVVCCAGDTNADLSVTVTDSPDPGRSDSLLTYLVTVINSGPAAATGVVLSNVLPAGVPTATVSPASGCGVTNGVVVCQFGTLAPGASRSVAISTNALPVGALTNVAMVAAAQTDPTPTNNTARAVTTVQPGVPVITIADVAVVEPNVTMTSVVFTVSLSHTGSQAVSVNFATAGGSATTGVDFLAATGLVTFPAGTVTRTIAVAVNGDLQPEGDETFYVNLSGAVNATLGDAQGRCTILETDGTAGFVSSFTWSAIGATQSVGVLFPVTLTARDAGGAVVSGFSGTVNLAGLIGAPGTASVLIAEVDTGVDQVEFVNVSALAEDVSGWLVTFYDWTLWPEPRLTFTVPAGTVVPGSGVFRVRDSGTFPGTYPAFFTGTNVSWLNDPATNQVAVLLRNAAGQVVDFFCAVDGYPAEIAVPLPLPAAQWQGGPVAANEDSSRTYQRTGSQDRNSSLDWTAAPANIGALNPGLAVPFGNERPVNISPTATANFVNGTWNGHLMVLEPATNVYIRADDRDGHRGASGTFTVVSAPPIPAVLSIARTGDVVRVSWPLAAGPYLVETKGSLAPTVSWLVHDPQATAVGNEYVLTARATNAAAFYRLRKF